MSAIATMAVSCSGPPATEDHPATSGAPAVNPRTWEPDQEISHRTYSDQELEQFRVSFLDEQAASMDIESPPEVELVRWTFTREEHSQALATCVTEAGFPAESASHGGVSFDPPPPAAQNDAVYLALYVCDAKYTPHPALVTDWTPEQIGMAWDYWNEAFIPCLEAQGVPIPEAEVPSRQTYIDTFFAGEPRWYPPAWVAQLGDRADAVEDACPPMPPHEYFYGS
ncbi:hypothetical protein HNR70_000265 [Brachybacterium aquaticum]|uniref:Uncharacterized protein n=1 Tax=Brachybacterium aquaticum TaxID=1432564 RepID=A0A841AAX3_9MICO|nr:hypothetical protein [Brachybacterium aquaticum]